jgi:hypothetical protein
LTHSQPLHHARAVDLNRPHADPQIVSDQLVRATCEQPVKHFPLARTEACDPPGGVGDIAVAIETAFPLERRLNLPEQSSVAVWFFQEVDCARLHRANRRLSISLAGHDNDCEVASYLEKLALDIQSAHAGQADIQQDTPSLERLGCRQKYVRMVERHRLKISRTQQPFH